MMRIKNLIAMFFMVTVLVNGATASTETANLNGWKTVVWTPGTEVAPESGLSIECLQDKVILTVTGDIFMTRVSGSLWSLDVDINDNANPDKPVLAPSIGATEGSNDLWTGKSQQVEIPWTKDMIRELTVVMADEASIEADRVVTLSHETVEMQPGENIRLSASYTLEGVPQTGIVWSIDNTDVAEIDQTGLLVAAKEGTATVKATTTDGRNLYATCALTVVKKEAVLPGDVNNDGVVAVNDVVLAINAVLGQTPEGFVHEAADMSGDGQIMVNDVVLMINVILGVNSSSVKARKFLEDNFGEIVPSSPK
ncbi:MAG: Ig-like domain-containing protein [Bacteroidaceae bacterium]|nr:Ig-like domain-containing protein [Bacteroidaceae bacterium]